MTIRQTTHTPARTAAHWALEGVRVAYVEAYARQVPEAEVGEILAREQGFEVRVFGNEADAAVWLRHGVR